MKKIVTILLILLMIFSLTCCIQNDKNSSSSGSGSSTTNKNPMITLNSFDNQEVMDRLMLKGVLGKVELNTTEKDYIKSGEGSAKVTVISDPYKMGQPCLYQATEFFKTNEDYSDFAKASVLSLWVYNAQPEKKKVGIQFVYNEYSVDLTEWAVVAASGWTKVQINVEREYLTVENGKATVQGVNVIFNRSENSDDIYYLDDFCLYRTEIPYTPAVMTLEGDEVCSFDKYWQVRKITTGCWGALQLSPSVEWVNDLTSNGLGSAIKVTTSNVGSGDQWPYVALNKTVFSLMDLSQYGSGDYICFDVYNPDLNGIDTIYVEAYSSTGLKFFVSGAITVKNGEWTTVRIAVDKLNGRGYFEDLAEFRVLHRGYKADSAKIFYLDEFRMEKGN